MNKNKKKQVFITAAFFFLLITAFLFIPGNDTHLFKTCRFSSPILSRDGKILRIIPLENGLLREKICSKDLPSHVKKIFRISEDKRFYFHPGVDLISIGRAFADNLRSGKTVSGASTITMQLSRQLVPHEGGLRGKIREALTAVRYNFRFSKNEVFTKWINTIPFGRNTEGIKSASRLFFGCSAEYLTERQSLVLAVVPRSPSEYDPVNSSENLVSAAYELSKRCAYDFSKDEIRDTVNNAANNIMDFSRPFYAPHFCNHIEKIISNETAFSGEDIITTLDSVLQEELETVLERKISEAQKFRISNAAGVFIIPESREVAAYAGSADYFSFESMGMNDGVTALRQPGSALKPFLYELALEKGFTASTLLPDIPLEFGKGEVYIPQNFNNTFHGPVRLRDALGSSLNVPAVYTLERIGVDNFRKRLVELGFRSLDGKKGSAGLSLALGGAEVSLLELVNSYCIFSDNHKISDPVFLLNNIPEWRKAGRKNTGKYRDNTDSRKNAYSGKTGERQDVNNTGSAEYGNTGIGADNKSEIGLIDPDAALIIRDILTDPLSRTTGFGSSAVFKSEHEVMIKTGTSNQFNNIWAAGLLPDLAGGIWMGNFSGDTVIGAPGSSLPADALLEIFNSDGGSGEFRGRGNTVKREICTLSGMLAGDYCSSIKTEIFKQGNIPEVCTFHTESGTYYPPLYSQWLSYRGIESGIALNKNQYLEILTPIDNASFILDPYFPERDQMIKITAVSGSRSPVVLVLDGKELKSGMNTVSAMVKLETGLHTVSADDGRDLKEITYTVR